jgi:hypothetical protein
MAKCSHNIGVNEIKALVLILILKKNLRWMPLIQNQQDLTQYSDDYCFKKWSMRKSEDRAVSDRGLNHNIPQHITADSSSDCFWLTFPYEQHYFTKCGDWVVSMSALYSWGLRFKNSTWRLAILSEIYSWFQVQDMKPHPSAPTYGQLFSELFCVYQPELKHSNDWHPFHNITQWLEAVMCGRSAALK